MQPDTEERVGRPLERRYGPAAAAWATPGGEVLRSQTWDPAGCARHARFVSDLGMPVLELLAPKPGERILDLGCGDGDLTEKIASRAAG